MTWGLNAPRIAGHPLPHFLLAFGVA